MIRIIRMNSHIGVAFPMAENAPNIGKLKKEPAIRTMKTDISEFLKTTKPSLISILARQAELEGHRGAEKTRFISPKTAAVLIGVIIALAGGFIAYRQISIRTSRPVLKTKPEAPAYIFFENTEEIAIGETSQELLAALRKAGASREATGAIIRLNIRLRNKSGAEAVIELGKFAELSGLRFPQEFSAGTISPPQFFIYHQRSGPAFGLMAESRNPARAIQALLYQEPSLQRDLEAVFLGSPPPASLETFKDLAYRNIDFRYLEMDKEKDRGLGYLNFPAKRLMVIATSQESLRLAIDRLFQSR